MNKLSTDDSKTTAEYKRKPMIKSCYLLERINHRFKINIKYKNDWPLNIKDQIQTTVYHWALMVY